MNWKKLKVLAIALLLLVDGFFLFMIVQRNYHSTHYDGEVIDSAIGVFRKSELYVDRSFLEDKVVTLPVYTGRAVSDLSQTAVARTLIAAGYRLSEVSGGIRCTDAIGEFYFGNDFAFYYTEHGLYDRPSDLLATERYIRLTPENVYRQDALRVAANFVARYNLRSLGEGAFDYEIAYGEVYSSGINYIVTLTQRIDGVPIYGEICLLISGGRVMAADGVFVTSSPDRRESAEMTDLINVLFMEKAFLDERYREGGSFSYTPMVLSKVVYSYAVYFDAEGTFYFVPLCTVSYMNGESRSYNCVSRKLYS